MLIAGVLAVWYRFDSYQKKVPGVLSSMWDRPAVCNNVGALTYHLADARNAFVHFFFKEKLPDEQLSEIRKFCETRNNGRLPGEYAGTARGRNLIIIQVESLQQFVVDLKINGIEVTPNLNRFARGSATSAMFITRRPSATAPRGIHGQYRPLPLCTGSRLYEICQKQVRGTA